MKLSIESSEFVSQVYRPSFEKSIEGFTLTMWEKRDEDGNYTQRRLYVKATLGRFSDDLGYIDLLSGEVIASKPRFASQIEKFAVMVQDAFLDWKSNNPILNPENTDGAETLPEELFQKMVFGNPRKGLKAYYGDGNKFSVTVWHGGHYFNLVFRTNGVVQNRQMVYKDGLNRELSKWQPDNSKWQVVESSASISVLEYATEV